MALLEATQRVTTEMKLLSSPIVLEFGGVGSFSRRVVFASIKEGLAKERLTSAAGQDQVTLIDLELHFQTFPVSSLS